jgi:hypothetical protein
MPTLVEYLATFPGRMFLLLSEDPVYTLHNTVSNDYVTIAKMEAYTMADCEKIMTLIRDNENWEILDEKMTFEEATHYLVTAAASEISAAVQTDLNPDIYMQIYSTDIIPQQIKFFLKEDNSMADLIFLTGMFQTRCWVIYTIPE